MARPLDSFDKTAIAQLVIYVFFFIGSVFLCLKHGFGRSSGWLAFLTLSLARLIGSGMRIGSISSPTNIDLYVGWIVLNGIGLGPLIISQLGLLTRVFASAARGGRVVVKPVIQRFIGTVMIAAVVLLAVGGSKSKWTLDKDNKPQIQYSDLSKAGVALMIVVLVVVVAEIALAFHNRHIVPQSEHRIIYTVAFCAPFIIVNLAYSCSRVLGGASNTIGLYLGTSVIVEIIVVAICEALGFVLPPPPKEPPKPSSRDVEMQPNDRQ